MALAKPLTHMDGVVQGSGIGAGRTSVARCIASETAISE